MSNRRQFGSLRKLPSGRWQASYWHLGLRHIAPVTFAFKADANVYLSSVETEVRRGLWIDPLGATVLFSDWAEQWRATTVDLRPSSRARDLGYLERYLLPQFGTMALGDIRYMTVRTWISELNTSGLAPSTVTKAGQLMSKIMRSAVQAGLVTSSPCDGVKMPRIERIEMRFLTTSEVDRLAEAMDPGYRAVVLLAAYGGLRAGELFGLRAKRVDVLRRQVAIAETVVDVGGHLHFGTPKTRAGHSSVPLPRVDSEPLGEHLATFARAPRISSSRHPRAALCHSTSGVAASGYRRPRRPAWGTCDRTTSVTQQSHCGSPRAHIPRKSQSVRDTRPSASHSTVTVTCFLGRKKCSMTRSMLLHTEAAKPMNQPSVRVRARRNPIPSRT